MGIENKSKLVIPDTPFGVCVWKLSDGSYIGMDGDHLCAEGRMYDKAIEARMEEAANNCIPDNDGKPHWLSDARKVTQSEWEDQMERAQEGEIPDWVDEARQREFGL